MHYYRELEVWNKAMDIAVKSDELTKDLPKEEKYSIVSQIRRSAVSVPSSIAEGAGRNSNKEFVQFLSFSTGSLFELETQFILSERLSFVDRELLAPHLEDSGSVSKMLFSLQKSFKSR